MKLLVAVSHHGLGHLAQLAPVLNALHDLQPPRSLTLWSGLAGVALQTRLRLPFIHREEPADIGLAMRDAVNVDIDASHSAYQAFHREWDKRVAREATWMEAQGFDGVLSDVAYLPLAAAARAGIPAVAMCSLNWRDIAAAYLSGHVDMAPALEQMHLAYQGARAFLRITPAMPMDWLGNRTDVPPVAARGMPRQQELAGRLGVQPRHWVLVGFGGITYQGIGRLPELPGVIWIVPDGWGEGRADLITIGATGMPFIDLLASCDALLTKVGYGSFVEAAAHGIPVIYVDRPDWPETPYLAAWLAHHGLCTAITEDILFSPAIGDQLENLLSMPARPPIPAEGACVAARRLGELLV